MVSDPSINPMLQVKAMMASGRIRVALLAKYKRALRDIEKLKVDEGWGLADARYLAREALKEPGG